VYQRLIGVDMGHQGHETCYGTRVTHHLAKPSPGWCDCVDRRNNGDTGGFAGGLI
jgi:hypothetical protein